jgi:hypothetical protein
VTAVLAAWVVLALESEYGHEIRMCSKDRSKLKENERGKFVRVWKVRVASDLQMTQAQKAGTIKVQ